MQVQPVPPAPSTPAVLSAPASAQIPSAHAAPKLPSSPTHPAQAAPPAIKPVPASPAPGATATQTAPPAAPATTPTATDPARDIADITTLDHTAPTPAPIDTQAETKLTAEITKLWTDRKNGNASVRRTRAELKSLRQQLSEKLHSLKAILVGTGREGGWAPYLRRRKLPLATANRYVAEHQARIAQPAEKLLNEQHVEPTVDQLRQMAQKLLPKLCRVLTTAELAFEFLDELFWNIPDAEGRETDDGLEVFRTSHEDEASVEDQAAEVSNPAPVVPLPSPPDTE